MLVPELLLAYWHQHASKLPSGKRIKASMRHLTEFFGDRTVKEACNPGLIDEFVKAMLKKGFLPTYVNNLLGILKAAITRAYRRGEIASAPFIALIPAQRKKRKGEPLETAQIAKLMEEGNAKLEMATMIMLGTACRPSSAYELTWEQVDFKENVIQLNQDGRPQTSKFRPDVKMPSELRKYLLKHRKASGLIITHGGKSIRRWETSWHNARERAELGKFANPYSIRHTTAKWMRKKGVPLDQIAQQMGHKQTRYETTEMYATSDPAYLKQACNALNDLLKAVMVQRAKLAA